MSISSQFKKREQKKKENRVRITAVRDEQLENLGYLKIDHMVI